MVGVDDDRVGRALQIDSPLAKGSHDGEQLFIVDRIVEFGRDELPGVVRDGVELARGVWLRQDAAEAEVSGVCFYGKGLQGLEVLQDWS